MVLFFTATLVISIFAMILLLAVKRYELVSGRVVFAGVRPGVGSFFEKLSRFGKKILPGLARQYVERVVRHALVRFHVWLAKTILTLQHWLERVLHIVREKTGETDTDREPSAFLREVADHKKSLSYKNDPNNK